MPNAAVNATNQSLTPGKRVALFMLDASPLGGPTMFFCQARFHDANVVFGGVNYTPVDCKFSGFEVSGSGTLPRPKLQLANTNGVFQNIINTFGDLNGCTLRRIRTYEHFLDGQPKADPAAYNGPDIFKVERKVAENDLLLEWELSAEIDQQGVMLPRRTVIRDTCLWRYRVWNATAGAFDYSRAQCPYTGSEYFDRSGNPVTADKDRCGRKISDCKLRFGSDQPLPTSAFPGAARFQP